jgi:hypothetical protein
LDGSYNWVSSPGDEMVRCWPHVTPVGVLGNQVPELHRIGRDPLHATNLIHILLFSCVVGVEKYRCFLGTTHENCCSLSMQNTEDKRQSGAVLSSPGKGFEPRMLAT